MREYVSGISGATLGYITCGTKCIIPGYKFGKRLGKTYPKMSPIPPSQRKRRARGPPTPSPSPKKRRGPYKPATHKYRKFTKFAATKKHSLANRLRKGSRTAGYLKIGATQNRMAEISQHNDMSYKNLRIVLNAPKHHKNLRGRYQYSHTWDFINTTGNEGSQNTDECKKMLTLNQITGVITTTRLDTISWGVDPIYLNPFVLSDTASTYFTGQQAYKEDRFHLETVNQKLQLLSLSSIPIKARVYWLQYKIDSDKSVSTIWAELLSAETMGQSGTVTPAQYTTTLVSTPGMCTINTLGLNPMTTPGFKKAFKMLNAQTIVLQPGDQKYFNVHFDIHKTFQRAVFLESKAQFKKNLTIVPFIIHNGGLVSITDSGGRSEVTTGTTKLGIFVQETFKFRALSPTRISTDRWYQGHVVNAAGDHAVMTSDTSREYQENDTDQFIASTSGHIS
nr:MAG: capsid protein [Cressdnaviricota sp.]